MSAIARILIARGESVSGSDVRESETVAQLRTAGARITVGHRAQNLEGARAVIVSSAIDRSNPEYTAAVAAGLPISRRGEVLAELMRGHKGIAVAGTHGKTTTTAMTAAVLTHGGVDATILIGGEAIDTGTNARDGHGEWLLTEADESDGSFMELDPSIALVTNIENDHIASDAELPRLRESFDAFLAKLPEGGLAVIGIDNAHSAKLAHTPRAARTITFGFSPSADVFATNISYGNLGSTFDVVAGGVCLGTVRLRVPGAINIENALGALIVGRELELPFARIAQALGHFSGVRRRFDILARTPRITVVDDYAHHPTAVKATIAAAKQYHEGPIVVAFQPHRYTRTAYLAADFANSLEGVDVVILTPVYAASEAPMDGVSERLIGEPLRERGAHVEYVDDVYSLPQAVLQYAPPGSLVLMLGAGNITSVAAVLADLAQQKRAAS